MIGALIAKRKVASGFESINRRDLDAFLANWADDATFVFPGHISVSGAKVGKPAIADYFRKLLDQYPKLTFTVKNVFVQNVLALGGTNALAVEWDIQVTNRNGRDLASSGVTIIHVKRSKVVFARDYVFDEEMVRQGWGEAGA